MHSAIDPYKPDGLREVVNVGRMPNSGKANYAMYQFSQDYVIATEKITIDLGNGNSTTYDGWAIRKVKYGQDPNGEVVDKKGVSKPLFSFNGRLETLPELHRALCQADADCNYSQDIRAHCNDFTPNEYGVIDISRAHEPEFPQHRVSASPKAKLAK